MRGAERFLQHGDAEQGPRPGQSCPGGEGTRVWEAQAESSAGNLLSEQRQELPDLPGSQQSHRGVLAVSHGLSSSSLAPAALPEAHIAAWL